MWYTILILKHCKMTILLVRSHIDRTALFNTELQLSQWLVHIACSLTYMAGQLFHTGRKILMFGDDTWLKLFPGFFTRTDGVNSFFVSHLYQQFFPCLIIYHKFFLSYFLIVTVLMYDLVAG